MKGLAEPDMLVQPQSPVSTLPPVVAPPDVTQALGRAVDNLARLQAPGGSLTRRGDNDASVKSNQAAVTLGDHSVAGVSSTWIDSEDNHSAIVGSSPDAA